MSKIVNILVVVLAIFALFIIGNCSLKCGVSSSAAMEMDDNTKEGYKRMPLAEAVCQNMQRSPVDYAFKNPNGWQQNPHYQTLPSGRFQPLEYGPIDFYADSRRMNELNGVLFQQYRNDWTGCGKPETHMVNDTMNRFNVKDLGDLTRGRRMANAWNPAFGPNKAPPFTEAVFERIDPTREKIYGGNAWLRFGRLESS
jgi:hypothetical protein